MMDTSLSVRGVAHDLNNELMVLLNSLDRASILDSEKSDLHLAMQAAERCVELVGQLLPRTRIHRETTVSVCAVIADAAATLRALLPEWNPLQVVCDVDCEVKADPNDLQQVLTNLCLNAADAVNGPGEIRVAVTTHHNSVAISVADSGPGVPEKLRELIFEPLFTTHSARGGNGLGLARVRELVTGMGGTVSVHDVFPQGACFRVVLPVASEPVELQ